MLSLVLFLGGGRTEEGARGSCSACWACTLGSEPGADLLMRSSLLVYVPVACLLRMRALAATSAPHSCPHDLRMPAQAHDCHSCAPVLIASGPRFTLSELGVVAQEAAHDKAMHEMKLVFHTTCLLCITNASACTSATRRVVAVATRR